MILMPHTVETESISIKSGCSVIEENNPVWVKSVLCNVGWAVLLFAVYTDGKETCGWDKDHKATSVIF